MKLTFAAFTAILAAGNAGAQLRPLEPTHWRLFAERATISAELGGARLMDQRASLAGEVGNLWEAGNLSLAWRSGRIAIEAGGTVQRFFRETSQFDQPYADVEPARDGRRHDSGDYRLSTIVRFTPRDAALVGAVRFGTRLPTTDNTTGLDRDAVDFFATLGGATSAGGVAVSAEAGLGIHTTREQQFEQDDLFLYAVRLERRIGVLTPSAAVTGQMHGTAHSEIRGVEDLGELRLGVRAGDRRWLRLEYVKGYETFSPSYGFIVTTGFIR